MITVTGDTCIGMRCRVPMARALFLNIIKLIPTFMIAFTSLYYFFRPYQAPILNNAVFTRIIGILFQWIIRWLLEIIRILSSFPIPYYSLTFLQRREKSCKEVGRFVVFTLYEATFTPHQRAMRGCSHRPFAFLPNCTKILKARRYFTFHLFRA